MQQNGKAVEVLNSRIDADAGVWGGCHTCRNRFVDMERYAPAMKRSSNGARQRFLAVLADLRTAILAKDWSKVEKLRAEVERLRKTQCDACRKRNKLSPGQRACQDEWDRMRQEACRKQDGCANPNCTERGMDAWIVITADHGTNEKRRNKEGKPVGLSNYKWWASYGGVEAMCKEAQKIHQWICSCCHALESTSTQGRVNNPETIARKPDETEKDFKKSKARAKITFPKYEYVNARKRAIGKCQYPGCDREVVRGNETSFDFDHRDESTKRMCRCVNAKGEAKGKCHGCDDKLFGRTGGLSGLASNRTKKAALEYADREKTVPTGRIKALFDAETDKCDLLCHNCHISRKPLGLPRHEEYARPAPPPARVESQTKGVTTADQPKPKKQKLDLATSAIKFTGYNLFNMTYLPKIMATKEFLSPQAMTEVSRLWKMAPLEFKQPFFNEAKAIVVHHTEAKPEVLSTLGPDPKADKLNNKLNKKYKDFSADAKKAYYMKANNCTAQEVFLVTENVYPDYASLKAAIETAAAAATVAAAPVAAETAAAAETAVVAGAIVGGI